MTIRKLAGLALLVTLWAGCFRDEGIVDVTKPGNIAPLAKFRGRAYNEGDTTLPSNRLLELVHPTIALVYHYIGTRENIRTMTEGVVATSPPFAFQIEMKQAPPSSIQHDDEVAVGLFWLFSDRNGNGKFDRGTHPEYAKKLQEIDSLTHLYYQVNDSLLAISEIHLEGVAVEETTLVGAQGLTLIRNGIKVDTVWPAMPAFSTTAMDAPFARQKVVLAQDRWEKFFDLRKRSNSISYSAIPNADYSLEMVMRYSRRLFPKSGMESKFNQGVIDLALLSTKKSVLATKYQGEAFQKGWLDYPYTGFEEPGADWGAGRSRDQFVFFFPTWKSIDIMRRAEKSSSFKIANVHQIVPGYNLMECDDQYNCRRLDESAEIKIYMGKSELYFNPPSVTKPFALPTVDSTLWIKNVDVEGTYPFQPGIDFSVQKVGADFWLDAALFGMTRLQMVDSVRGVGMGLAMQIQFVSNEKHEVEKMILDWKGERYVAVKTSNRISAGRSENVTNHAQAQESELSTGITVSLKQSYRWYGLDTLKFSEASSKSVWLSGKGIPKQKFVAVDSNTLISQFSGIELKWRRKSDQMEGEWYLLTGGTEYRIPPIFLMGTQNDTAGLGAYGLIQDVQGTARETFVDFQGKPRFSCAEDSLYLVNGDSGLRRNLPVQRNDQIALEGDGEFEIEVPVDSSSDSLSITLDFCGAKNSGKQAALMRVLWKSDSADSWSEMMPSFWLPALSNGSRKMHLHFATPLGRILGFKFENLSQPGITPLLSLDRYRIYSK